MLIKTIKNPRDILIMSDDEFEQAVTQSDYLSLADIAVSYTHLDVYKRQAMKSLNKQLSNTLITTTTR